MQFSDVESRQRLDAGRRRLRSSRGAGLYFQVTRWLGLLLRGILVIQCRNNGIKIDAEEAETASCLSSATY